MLCCYFLPPAPSSSARHVLSLGLLGTMTAMALSVANLARFIALRGAILGSLLVYSLPATIGLAWYKRSWSKGHGDQHVGVHAGLLALGAYGAVASLLGTVGLLAKLNSRGSIESTWSTNHP